MENRQSSIQAKSKDTLTRSSSLVLNGNGHRNIHYMAQSPFVYDVMIEKTDSAYIARILFWPQDVIIATTREEALEKAEAAILHHLSQAEFVTVSVDPQAVSGSLNGANSHMEGDKHHTERTLEPAHPLSEFFGMNRDYPDELEEMQSEIARYRDELDKEWGMGQYMVDEESTDNENSEIDGEQPRASQLVETDIDTKKAIFA